jgi:single-strand DNA-binding protein
VANKAILLGRLKADPEVTTASTGTAVAKFVLATSETYKGKKTTYWHKIIAWGKLAEICGKYLVKGQQAYVEGKITYRDWEKDGKKNYATEIVIDKVEFVGSKEKPAAEEPYSDIPF